MSVFWWYILKNKLFFANNEIRQRRVAKGWLHEHHICMFKLGSADAVEGTANSNLKLSVVGAYGYYTHSSICHVSNLLTDYK